MQRIQAKFLISLLRIFKLYLDDEEGEIGEGDKSAEVEGTRSTENGISEGTAGTSSSVEKLKNDLVASKKQVKVVFVYPCRCLVVNLHT